MSGSLSDDAWPAARLGEALQALGGRCGGALGEIGADAPPSDVAVEGGERLDDWIAAAAARLGLEAVPVALPYADVGSFFRRSGPVLIRLPTGPERRFLILLGSGRRRASLLGPDLKPVEIAPGRLRAVLCERVEAPWSGEVDRLVDGLGLAGHRRVRVRAALLREYLYAARVGGCWLVRPGDASGAMAQVREAGLPRLLARFLGAQALAQVLWIVSWWLLGGMALSGRFDPGRLGAWLLLLVTVVALRLVANVAGGELAIGGGAVLKRRLLLGSLRLDPDEVRHLGVGQLLGRVVESGAMETLALTGGFLGLSAILELVLAVPVLAAGAGGDRQVILLLATSLAAVGLGVRYARRLGRWTEERLALTDDLVERMAGHRTRLAQEAPERRHEGEDRRLARYLDASRDLDRAAVALQVLTPRGWLLIGLAGLAPSFLAGNDSPGSFAVGVGGLLLASRAFRDLAEGLERVAGAAVAWTRIAPFWRAAARREPLGDPRFATRLPGREDRSLLDVRGLVFRHRDCEEPVLRGVSVRIRAGDRLLLEGPSGGGKSTLAALLAGCRLPDVGLLLFDGLDRETLGADGWRRRIVLAPQSHENHVFMGTLAFNALMGRDWPPRPADLAEAERVCRALGLGPLLDRMPAGLHQVVGETGWQLSHGEKGRLYVARALLQEVEILILDESFAALDPRTLRRTLACVEERASSVLLIAHP